jgi:hypothetical protein
MMWEGILSVVWASVNGHSTGHAALATLLLLIMM